MKKKILGAEIVIFLIAMLFILTGCVDNKNNNIVNELNSAISEIDDYSVSKIQSALKEKTKLKLLDSSREEFQEKPSSSSSQFRALQLSEQLINTGASYVLIYDTENETYYSVSVSYQSYKPVFSKVNKIQ